MTSDLGGTRRPDGTDPSRPAPAAFSSTEEPVSDAEQWARDGVAPHVDAALADELGDEYEILEELGRGGSAVVYRARDRRLHREIALKVVRLPPAFAAGEREDAVARLAREARTVARLEHPNIVGVHAVRELRDGLAVSMPLVRGPTLKQLLQREGALAPDRAARVLRDVAVALDFAHDRGVVHRDVKPENIFIDEATGRAVLSDFGSARTGPADVRVTRTGTTVGTPAYMSPEQIDGGPVDARTDLYSLGLVAWEMLTGRRPWEGEGLYALLHRQKHEQVPPIEAVRPTGAPPVPLTLQYVVERLLEKHPGARWASAAAVASQLERPVLPPDFKLWQRAHERRVAQIDRRATSAGSESALAPTEKLPARPVATRVGDAPAPPEPEPASATSDETQPSWMRPEPSRRGRRRVVAAALGALLLAGAAASPLLLRTAGGRTAAPLPARVAEPPAAIVVPAAPIARGPFLDSTGGDADALAPDDSTLPDTSALALGEDAATEDDAPTPSAEPAPEPPAPARRIAPRPAPAVATPPAPPSRITPAPAAPPPAIAAAPAPARIPAASPAAPPAVSPSPTPIAAGGRHSCALDGAGRAICWGANDDGQLGTGDLAPHDAPTPVIGELRFTRLTSGGAHSCALRASGDAYCWGDDDHGQLGDGGSALHDEPSRVSGVSGLRDIRAGLDHTCAIVAGGAVWCWGANGRGQLGDATTTDRATPVLVRGLRAASALATGWRHSCTLASDGVASCWGDNADGQLGDGTTSARSLPTVVRTPLRFTAIAAGATHTCAVATDGDTYCWGRIGATDGAAHALPTRVESPARFTSLVAGSVHTCGRTAAGAVWCWGRNPYGQLGDGTTTDRARPVRVSGGPFGALSAAGAHTCATEDGAPVCWGYNVSGQIGDGSRAHRPSPTRPTGGSS